MDKEERLISLKRALSSMPFFTKLPFEITPGADKTQLFGNRLEVNADFYLTNIQSNLGSVFTATGALFNMSVWTQFQKSVYRFDAGQLLPSGFIASEARFDTPVPAQIFDDRQREICPFLVKNGNKLFGSLENLTTKGEDIEAVIVLSGFQKMPSPFIDLSQLEGSLSKETRFEYFKFTVDKEGKRTYHIENDVFPRLILGFGARNSTVDKSKISASTMIIKDYSRRLQLSDEPIPVEFYAPRLTCLRDTHIYYLPIEYYLQPFARLNFEVNNVSPDRENESGYEFVALTRTV